QSRGPAWRISGGDGTIRVRQIDLHAHRRLPGSPDLRPVLPRRTGRVADEQGCPRCGAEPQDWLRVPGVQSSVTDFGARQRRAAALVPRKDEVPGSTPAGNGGTDG